jgi:hypothetical protein
LLGLYCRGACKQDSRCRNQYKSHVSPENCQTSFFGSQAKGSLAA